MREIKLNYPAELFTLWKQGKVHAVLFWEHRYLFDERDLAIAKTQCAGGYHFGEWFAAIHFSKQGYNVLVEKYWSSKHERKFRLARRVLHGKGMRMLDESEVAPPDLLVFKPTSKSFFFAEVKRAKDKLRLPQKKFFERLEKELACRVLLVNLIPASSQARG